ncbi:hypothetical protein ARMSODRAFT_180831 [Armillaria solidipes]|uniref:Uncharacterized protein n=1 Tax=Armillaria solidipes TaxID=1076256 RepID=A0A2H3BHR6_9AGAR|nr:hypothetical protein ARMSODRAFT_180831 [Armillaria solidipes]
MNLCRKDWASHQTGHLPRYSSSQCGFMGYASVRVNFHWFECSRPNQDTRLNPLRLQPFSSLGNSIALRKIFTILSYVFLELRWTVFSIWILGLQHGEKV